MVVRLYCIYTLYTLLLLWIECVCFVSDFKILAGPEDLLLDGHSSLTALLQELSTFQHAAAHITLSGLRALFLPWPDMIEGVLHSLSFWSSMMAIYDVQLDDGLPKRQSGLSDGFIWRGRCLGIADAAYAEDGRAWFKTTVRGRWLSYS